MDSVRQLPTEIPLMLVRGIVLLPHASLSIPLQDEEAFSYFTEVAKKGGFIGVVQPCYSLETLEKKISEEKTLFFRVGTLGTITNIQAGDDGELFLMIKGICRFRMTKCIEQKNAYFPKACVDYDSYSDDLVFSNHELEDRPRFIRLVTPMFEEQDIIPEWDSLFKEQPHTLMNNIMMVAPLIPEEKQAVLQQKDILDQSNLFMNLLEMSNFSPKMSKVSIH